MLGTLDDDLGMLRRRITIRKNANLPRLAIPRDLRRRLILGAGTEWTRRAFENVGTLLALRRENHRIVCDRRPLRHERSSRIATRKRWMTPTTAATSSSAASHSATVNPAKYRALQPFVKRMYEMIGSTMMASTNSPRPTDS